MANRIKNALHELFQREPRVEENQNSQQVVNNSLNPLSQEYFRRGNWKALENIMRDKKVNETDLYNGYLFSALELRKNSFAEFAEDNIITKPWGDTKVDYHPYLQLIEESKEVTEYEFWSDLITDWDMKGEAFIFLLRRVVYGKDKDGNNIVTHLGMPTSIEILDANKVVRLTDSLGKTLGYEEWLDTTHKRVFAPEQIIHIWNKNPFNKDEPYSIFDAAKDFQYTLNKGTSFTQAALANNSNTPGIISTDQVLSAAEYDNLVAKINSHEAGQVIVTDGAGKLNYTAISQALDSTALSGITDVSRQVIFAVTGTSKTMLGIEESGTTRETAKVQYNKFLQKTITPIVKRVVSALNFDFRTHYPEKYNSFKVDLIIKDDSDPTSAKEGYESQKFLFDSVLEMTYSGYTAKSAEEFMLGEISFTELELDGQDAIEIDQEALGTDQIHSTEDVTDSDQPDSDSTSDPDNPDSDEPDDSGPGDYVSEEESSLPKVGPLKMKDIISKQNDIESSEHCHHHGESLESWIDNTLMKSYKIDNSSTYGKTTSAKLKGLYNKLRADLKKIQTEAIQKAKVTNAVKLTDIRTTKEANETEEALRKTIKDYMRHIITIASRERKEVDKLDWQLDGNVNILGEKEVNSSLDEVTELIAKSHTETLYKEMLRQIQKRDNSLTEKDMEEAIRTSYTKIVNTRLNVLSESVFVRAIGMGNYWTDYFLIKINGKEKVAYKTLFTEYSDPCEFCQQILNEDAIPFNEPFVGKGEKITVKKRVDGEEKTSSMIEELFPVDFGMLHPNCRCIYALIIKDVNAIEKIDNLPEESTNPVAIIKED